MLRKNEWQRHQYGRRVRSQFKDYNIYTKITIAQCIFNHMNVSELLEHDDYVILRCLRASIVSFTFFP